MKGEFKHLWSLADGVWDGNLFDLDSSGTYSRWSERSNFASGNSAVDSWMNGDGWLDDK